MDSLENNGPRTLHFTKIILVTWLCIVAWNSDKIFNPVINVPVDPFVPVNQCEQNALEQPIAGADISPGR